MNTPLMQWTLWIAIQNGLPLPQVINGLDLFVNPIGGTPSSQRNSQRQQKDQINRENISVAPDKLKKMCCPTIRIVA